MRALPMHLVAVTFLAAAAACGGAAGSPPQLPSEPVGTSGGAGATGGVQAAPAASAGPGAPAQATVPPASTAPSPSGTAVAPAVAVPMKPIVASAMAADLQALGLDPAHLPPIEKIDAKQLRGAMRLIAKSLGARCSDCHEEGDFAAPTPRKRVAAKMWNEFVSKLTLADGGTLFCDSCHQGQMKELDRTDGAELARWMDANFVDKLKRRDDRDEECESCHVDMDMHFLNKWAAAR